MNRSLPNMIRPMLLLPGLLWLAACGKPPGPQGPPGGMAMPVIAAAVQRKPLEERLPLVGSLQPKEDIRVLSEADARIDKIGFQPGQIVEEGTVLFELDARRQKAALAEGEAKELMVSIFHAIGVRSPLADDYRAKLTRLLY